MDKSSGKFRSAAVFGATGGIGAALCEELLRRGAETVHAGSRGGNAPSGMAGFAFDLEDESSIAQATAGLDPLPELIIVSTGVLTLPNGAGPEKTWRAIDADTMSKVLQINTIGPALIASHALSRMPRNGRAVFAALSARVGSIGDNRIGGWHSYRASKAALNMLIRNFAIELTRTRPDAIAVGLHPGTVDTALSEPFQANVPEEQLFTPQRSAAALLDVLEGLQPADSGGVFAWDGQRIPD